MVLCSEKKTQKAILKNGKLKQQAVWEGGY